MSDKRGEHIDKDSLLYKDMLVPIFNFMTSNKNINHLRSDNGFSGILIEFTIPETEDKIHIDTIDVAYLDDYDQIIITDTKNDNMIVFYIYEDGEIRYEAIGDKVEIFCGKVLRGWVDL